MTIKEKILGALNKYTTRLKDIVLSYDDVVNNCTTASSTVPLSAAQGKFLQGQIDQLEDQIGGVKTLSKCLEPGESATFDMPLLTRAVAICIIPIIQRDTNYNYGQQWLYFDSQPGLVYIGNMRFYPSGNSKMLLSNDEQSVTFSNNHTSSPWSLFFIVFNGSVSIRE